MPALDYRTGERRATTLFGREVLRSRSWFALALFIALFSLSLGCSSTPKANLPKVIGENPSSTDFIQAVNANTEKIRSIRVSNGRVGVRDEPGTANCSISFLREDKFRLVGSSSLMGGRVIDCGTDGQTFWFWNKLGGDDKVYTCANDRFRDSYLSEAFPVDPSWFPEALGYVRVNENDVVDGPRPIDDGNYFIRVKRPRPDGVYTERICFKPLTAAIYRQDVQAPDGRTVVTVKCKEHQYLEDEGVVLPRKLEIYCPVAETTFEVDLADPVINDEGKLMAFEPPTDVGSRTVDLSGTGTTPVAPATPSSPSPSSEPPVESPAPAASAQAAPIAPENPSLQGSNTVDATRYKTTPVPPAPTYSAPVESGAGVVPFPSDDEVANEKPTLDSYRVVPESTSGSKLSGETRIVALPPDPAPASSAPAAERQESVPQTSYAVERAPKFAPPVASDYPSQTAGTGALAPPVASKYPAQSSSAVAPPVVQTPAPTAPDPLFDPLSDDSDFPSDPASDAPSLDFPDLSY